VTQAFAASNAVVLPERNRPFPDFLVPIDSVPPVRMLARCLYCEPDEVTSLIILDFKGGLDIPFMDHLLYFFSTALSRLSTEAQLTRSQLQLSETQQLVKVGRLQYDFATDRSILSKELCSLCGVPETTTAVELIRMIHPDDQPAFAQVMDRIIEFPTHDEVRFNFRMVHPDGHTLYLRSHSKIHFNDAGRPEYIITAIHDATEVKTTRDQLEQRHHDLERLAKERQLIEERISVQVSELEHVNKNLNTALMVKDEFLASMSSNLKAPLTAIFGAVDLLKNSRKGALNEDQERYVALVERSGNQLLDAINAILDLTKFSLHKEEIAQEKVSLNDLCTAGMHFAQTFANRKSISLQYDLKAKNPFIIGDPIRLRQINTILLKQAISSAPEKGTVQLNVFTHTDPQYVWIQILDNGTQSISTILEPGQQGVDPHSQQSLELEIASRLIELHGGTLRVLHQKDQGNTVIVLLPRQGISHDGRLVAPPPEEDTLDDEELHFRR
jgi:signal transduction histidine kinase